MKRALAFVGPLERNGVSCALIFITQEGQALQVFGCLWLAMSRPE